MKLLHIADLHIGKRVNGISMVDDQRYIFDQILSIAKNNGVDAVLIAGDIYDKASPSAEAVTVFDALLIEFARAGITVLAVPGNHDSAERIAYARGFLSNQGVHFPSVYNGEIETVVFTDEHGPVNVWLLPYVIPADAKRFFPDAEIGQDFSAALRAVLGACDVDRTARNVIVSHQFVTAVGQSTERADEEIRLGGMENVDVGVYDDFDYVALGHVHRPQRVGRDTVRYAGSPLKYSFGEARYDKSVVLVELGPKKAGDEVGACVSYELIPLVPLHDMREVCIPFEEVLAGGAGQGEAAQDYLHITLTDVQPQLDAMARAREIYPNIMALDYTEALFASHLDSVHKAVDPERIDTVDLFARFYEEQVGKAMDDIQRDIVAKVVRRSKDLFAKGDK